MFSLLHWDYSFVGWVHNHNLGWACVKIFHGQTLGFYVTFTQSFLEDMCKQKTKQHYNHIQSQGCRYYVCLGEFPLSLRYMHGECLKLTFAVQENINFVKFVCSCRFRSKSVWRLATGVFIFHTFPRGMFYASQFKLLVM